MMNVVDLRELIQDDIICCVDEMYSFTTKSRYESSGYLRHDDREDLKNMLCQIVVDRINEYEKGE